MKFLKILLSLMLFFNISYTFAWVVDHFEVEFNKEEANVGEALDLTIKAVDENWEVVTDYLWSIIGFSETDEEVELPTALSSDEWYTFKASDEWVVKFENWVIFHKEWEQELWIYDTDSTENIIWLGRIKINKTEETQNLEIEILSPEEWLTIWDNKIKVSWKTEKNHQVLIIINEDKEFNTISNTQWVFEKEVTNLKTWENVIQAYVLDADWNKVWTSNKVIIKVDDNKPKFKKITLAPLGENWEVDEGKNIIVNLYATPDLKEVSLIVNDQIIKLEETEAWVYTWNFNAPKWGETYQINAILKDNLWHTITKNDIAQIKVNKVELTAAPIEEKPKIITSTWEVCDNIDLKIKWLKLVELKNKSVLTWDKVENADWYKIYKKTQTWEFIEVADINKEVFEIPIVWDKLRYEYFAVKAYKNCENKAWTWTIFKSGNFSEATKIKTWPELIILLLISLLLWAWFVYFRNKQA